MEEPPARTVLYFSLCITLGSLPMLLFGSGPPLDLAGLADVVAVGLLATLGQFMLTLAYQRGHTLVVSLLGYSQVILTSLLGIALWGTHPSGSAWLGMGLVIVSGAIGPLTSFNGRQSAPRASPEKTAHPLWHLRCCKDAVGYRQSLRRPPANPH